MRLRLVLRGVLDIAFIKDLSKYLGVLVAKGRSKRATYGLVLDKINTRLTCWKSKLLNLAGQATLA